MRKSLLVVLVLVIVAIVSSIGLADTYSSGSHIVTVTLDAYTRITVTTKSPVTFEVTANDFNTGVANKELDNPITVAVRSNNKKGYSVSAVASSANFATGFPVSNMQIRANTDAWAGLTATTPGVTLASAGSSAKSDGTTATNISFNLTGIQSLDQIDTGSYTTTVTYTATPTP